jgi:hypothetical protein
MSLVLACSCKKENENPAAPAVPPAPPPQISCEKAIPATLVAKYFPNTTTEFTPAMDTHFGDFVTSCRFVGSKDAPRRTLIEYRCGPTFSALEPYLLSIESQVSVKYERIANIGRGAYQSKLTFGALHRTMPCVIEVQEMSDQAPPDYRSLVTDLEAALTP